MSKVSRRFFLASTASVAALPRFALARSAAERDTLSTGFLTPPASARPRVWWHWMNGNVTLDGVRKDFEWMQRVGIGGVQNFDASLSTPVVVDKPIVYMTPEWQQVMRQTVALADQKGLEFTVHSSPGWSETGGPWVTVEQAMKKIVWTETEIQGGKPFRGMLPTPPDTAGPFGNVKVFPLFADEKFVAPAMYRDAAVVAYRAPAQDLVLNALKPVVTTSGGPIDAKLLFDGDLQKMVTVPYSKDAKEVWIQFAFAKPQTARAVGICVPQSWIIWLSGAGNTGRIEASDDGVAFRRVADVRAAGAPHVTTAFEAVTARYFRIVFEAQHKKPPSLPGIDVPIPTSWELSQLLLHGGARIDAYESKAGFDPRVEVTRPSTPVDTPALIAPDQVIDLTDKMAADGTLVWTPPAGRWIVLRYGYSPTGVIVHPASEAGVGLEVDKLNKDHVKAYIDTYIGKFRDAVGSEMVGKRGLTHVLIDSYESGPCNWTEGLMDRFRERRGYDMRPWLPVLSGRVVGSVAASEGFLWDFRKTLSDLMSDEHHGQIAKSLHDIGVQVYAESHEGNRAMIADGMEVKKHVDIPMGAQWLQRGQARIKSGSSTQLSDIRESASVAHVYGKTFVGAESLTAAGDAYAYAPEHMKTTADLMMANGLNRFIIHTSVHQPLDRTGPGFGLGPFGQWFTRKETWAEQAGAWMDYLARSSHLLQQGRFVADIAYYYAEDYNITRLFMLKTPDIPAGYDFDFVNADILMNELSVQDGSLRTRGGMTYRVLYLDPSAKRMTLGALRSLGKLVDAGATVIGAKPEMSPSQGDSPAEFARLADRIWASGKVRGDSLAAALPALGIAPDFTYTTTTEDPVLLHVHRRLDDAELYFVNSRNPVAQTVEASFRISGRIPELWRAETGAITPLSYRTEAGRTIVPLNLEPSDAVFVVFRNTARVAARTVPRSVETTLATLAGPWEVAFQPDRGAPPSIRLPELVSWTTHADPGVKYFSGTARYSNQFALPRVAKGARIVIELGDVENVADVVVNGKNVGTVWKPPFRIDVTDAVRVGRNSLEVRVTNLWPNRLIGDKQAGAKPIAFATNDPYTATSKLLDSGLLGPVRILSET